MIHKRRFLGPRSPVAPSCVAKIGYEETVRKVYEIVKTAEGEMSGVDGSRAPTVL